MSENTVEDIEENGTEYPEDTEPSGAEVREEGTEEEASASLEDLKKENKDLLKQLADVDNYKKDLEKKKQGSLDREKRKMGKLLPVLDSFEKAIKDFGEPNTDRQKDILDGIKNMHKQVFTVLQKFGVVEIDSGEEVALDPSHHEAE